MLAPDKIHKIAALNFLFTGFWISVTPGVLLCSVGILYGMMTRVEPSLQQTFIGQTDIADEPQVVETKTTARVTTSVGIIALIAASIFGGVLSDRTRRQINDDTDPLAFVKAAVFSFFPLLVACVAALYVIGDFYVFRRHRIVALLLFALIVSIASVFFFKSIKDHAVSLLESESDGLDRLQPE